MTVKLWETLSERSSLYQPTDYERAAYRLVTSQVLTAADSTTRKDYHLVADQLSEFKSVLAPFAIELKHDATFQYVVAIPRHVLRQRMASKLETLFVIVLYSIYHRVRMASEEDDFGQAIVDLAELDETFRNLTGRELPGAGELRQLLAATERWGIARREDTPQDLNPFRIVVSPVITEIVTEAWLNELAALRRPTEDDEVADVDGDHEEPHVPA